MFENMHSRVPQHNQCVSTPAVLFTCLRKGMYAYKTSQAVSFTRRKIMWITTNPSRLAFRISVADPDLLIKEGEGGRSYINTYIDTYMFYLLVESYTINSISTISKELNLRTTKNS